MTQQAQAGSELEVLDLSAFALREPVSKRAYTVIRVRTRPGLTGYGECKSVSAAEAVEAKAAVLGRDATAYEVVRRQLQGTPGLQAAVNMALLDVIGKHTKAPLYQVLGGPTRNKARAMTALRGASEAELAESMKRAREAGFRAFLVPVPVPSAPNQGQAFVNATRSRLEALRSAGGEEADFVLDGRGSLTPGDAASLSKAFERFHLLWFDEPVGISNLAAVRKLSAESVTPVGFGRHIQKGGEFQDLLREEAVDVLRPDISLNGVTQIRKMAALAETYYVAVAPYHDGGPIATAAALHAAASIPNFFIQQIPLPEAEEDRRMREELTSERVEVVRDGFAELPRGLGLGITVNDEALEKYRERAA